MTRLKRRVMCSSECMSVCVFVTAKDSQSTKTLCNGGQYGASMGVAEGIIEGGESGYRM